MSGRPVAATPALVIAEGRADAPAHTAGRLHRQTTSRAPQWIDQEACTLRSGCRQSEQVLRVVATVNGIVREVAVCATRSPLECASNVGAACRQVTKELAAENITASSQLLGTLLTGRGM